MSTAIIYCFVYTLEAEAFKFKDANISILSTFHILVVSIVLNDSSNESYKVEPSTLNFQYIVCSCICFKVTVNSNCINWNASIYPSLQTRLNKNSYVSLQIGISVISCSIQIIRTKVILTSCISCFV